MSQNLTNKTALITGAGNGIGREIALRFAAEGARIVSLDTDEAGNARTASLILEAGGSCDPVQGDCSVAADTDRAFRVAGRVDILINNAAAWAGDGFLHKLTEQDWDHVVDVCLKSVFLCCRQALREMMERRSGVIVNMSSVNALTGIHLSAYTAAKGGILSLTRLLAYQYGQFGIRINAICPGTILTESTRQHYAKHPEAEAELLSLYPAKAFGTPADIAECALYLCSDQASFINGSTIVVDGGLAAGYRIASLYESF
jgi:NAD(P)-dependent dehydrogenase (short-subunit alcohol dehydrogenase family)